MPDFQPFRKIPRLSREVIFTEKIDGTNGLIYFSEDGDMSVGSRTRWISPGKGTDNFGFAAWAYDHEEELRLLGPGYHYGEWWGHGIQRGYGLPPGERRFSLFNVSRWGPDSFADVPACCSVVPILMTSTELSTGMDWAMSFLREGSRASPGFLNPEGVIAYHIASGQYFKKTFEKDDEPKGRAQ